MNLLLLLSGFVLLLLGGEWLVRGAAGLAGRLGISPLTVGLVLVGFGTSTPELMTSVQAALLQSPGIAVGNVIGSNSANILLILGLAAVIRPLSVTQADFRRHGTALALATLVCVGLMLSGRLNQTMGMLLVGGLTGYLIITIRAEKQRLPEAGPDAIAIASTPAWKLAAHAGLFLAGLLLTVFGAKLLVTGAIALSRSVGISETVIGLTLVAVGTSLPELVTSTVAALRGHSDIAFGNVVGSNIYNIFGILGATALIHPIPVPAAIIRFDLWVMVFATLLLLSAVYTGRRVSRIEGVLLLGFYLGYMVVLATGWPPVG